MFDPNKVDNKTVSSHRTEKQSQITSSKDGLRYPASKVNYELKASHLNAHTCSVFVMLMLIPSGLCRTGLMCMHCCCCLILLVNPFVSRIFTCVVVVFSGTCPGLRIANFSCICWLSRSYSTTFQCDSLVTGFAFSRSQELCFYSWLFHILCCK